MEEGRLPKKEDIDAVITDRPVFLQRTCAHIAVLNSKAIDICNITKNTKTPFWGGWLMLIIWVIQMVFYVKPH